MVKKIGPLERGVVFESEKDDPIRQEIRAVDLDKKFQLLFKKYEVEEGNWMHLAVCLAMKYETGLKPIKFPGQKKGYRWLWTPERDKQLLDSFRLLLSKKMSIRAICKELKGTDEFKDHSIEGLRKQYMKLCKKTLGP